ncbi:deoxyribonuclease-1-like [Mya arenaria]|uniref:deoxyribonuclease-1-like n=1 Tax=Mya arenaria TaxID=6604 RepID=UPI0022E825D8|nr:deoxyribonuclease-1-like [Mya arenaria]
MMFHTVIFFLASTVTYAFVLDDVSPTGSNGLPALAEPPLRIGSFNIQVFGITKFSNKPVVDILVQILSRYDIVQILEIRDSHQTAFEGLRVELNKYVSGRFGPSAVYEKVVSERLGRTASKEQYGFLYRPSRVTVTDTYQYHDIHDLFEREPFSVKFNSPTTVIKDFVMVANHIQPSAAREEMDNLTKVYTALLRHWHLEDVIIGGDFNADCNYLRLSDWKNISLKSDPRYTWLIDDDIDTTVSQSSCSYDRFVIAGNLMKDSVVPGSVHAFRFDEEMHFNKTMALAVSDHYPIELQLEGSPHVQTQQGLRTSISFTVVDSHPVANVNDIRSIYHTPSCASSVFTTKLQMEASHMDFVTAHTTVSDDKYIMSNLMAFRSSCPGTISAELLSMTDGYLKSAFITHAPPDVYGLIYSVRKEIFDILIKCSLQPPYTCELTISKQLSGH